MTSSAREQISTSQVAALFVISRLALTLTFFGAGPGVRQDVWWENVLDVLMTILVAWLLNHLWQRFPQQNLLQVAEVVLGKVLGRLVGLLYVLFLLLILSQTLRLAGEVFVFSFLPRTPIIVVIAVVAGLAAAGTRAGIEVIARSSQVIFPILIGSVVLTCLLLFREIRFAELLPLQIFKTGPIPHLKSSISVAARTIELVWVGMLVPLVDERQRLLRTVIAAEIWLGALWILMSVSIVGILGGDLNRFHFPWYTATQVMNIGNFLEQIDALILAVWVLGMFIRCAMLLWAAAVGTGQWLGLQAYRPLALPLAGLAVSYAIGQAETFTELLTYLKPEVYTPFTFAFVIFLPVVLLLIAQIRRIRGAGRRAAKGPR